jgi:hypothetical protein
VLQKTEEGELVLEVQFDPKYEPLIQRQAEKKTLWVPGDKV